MRLRGPFSEIYGWDKVLHAHFEFDSQNYRSSNSILVEIPRCGGFWNLQQAYSTYSALQCKPAVRFVQHRMFWKAVLTSKKCPKMSSVQGCNDSRLFWLICSECGRNVVRGTPAVSSFFWNKVDSQGSRVVFVNGQLSKQLSWLKIVQHRQTNLPNGALMESHISNGSSQCCAITS